MVTADVGRIIITDDEVPVGIFTEKDVLKRVVNKKIDPSRPAIKDVMTSPIRAVQRKLILSRLSAKCIRAIFGISSCAEDVEILSALFLCAVSWRSQWS